MPDISVITITDTEINLSISPDQPINVTVTEVPEIQVVTVSEQGPVGPQGLQGIQGPAGQGVPVGGTTGQVLAKINGADYNTQWVNQSGGGSSALRYPVTLDFGNEQNIAVATVSDTGATADSVVFIQANSEDLGLQGVCFGVEVTIETGYTITAYAPHGASGQYTVMAIVQTATMPN